MERTLVLIKPDGIQRGLVGQIISRIESRGLRIVAMKMLQADRALAMRHYDAHLGKEFFRGLVDFMISSPIIAMVLEGPDAITLTRATMGATDPKEAVPGTIRGDLGVDIGRNLIHGSDGLESATKEIETFFSADEILNYQRDVERWIIEL